MRPAPRWGRPHFYLEPAGLLSQNEKAVPEALVLAPKPILFLFHGHLLIIGLLVNFQQLLNACLLYTSRSHTRQELLDKLLRNYEREICEDVVQRLEQIGLINDEDYARRAAATMLGAKHYGEMRVRQELLRRGIERELVETVLEELDVYKRQEEGPEAYAEVCPAGR